MTTLKITLLILATAAFLLITNTNAQNLIDFRSCSDSCEIKEVRVDSCHQYEPHSACKIRRRKPAKMSFDFVPKFDSETLEAHLTWVKDTNQELPLATLERDACKTTKCPTKTGEQQTYTIDVPIESKFPTSGYTIKWNLKSPTDGNACCFLMDIKVVR